MDLIESSCSALRSSSIAERRMSGVTPLEVEGSKDTDAPVDAEGD